MATHGDPRISTRPQAANHGPGLFSRLLQRTKSKKERKQDVNEGALDAGTNLEVRVPEPSYQSSAIAAPTAPPRVTADRQPTPTAPSSTVRSPAVHLQQPPPTLKKRASIRNRFRSLAKGHPSSVPEPEPEKQRAAYVPTHAAADFLRLAFPPRPASRQQQRPSYEDARVLSQPVSEPPTPIVPNRSGDEPRSPAGPRHCSQRGLDTLDENDPAQAHRRIRQHVYEIDTPRSESSFEDSHQQREGQGVIRDTESPPANLSVSQPVHVSRIPEHSQSVAAGSERDATQTSDYELFLTRAEERERAYREQVLRAVVQHQNSRPEPEAIAYRPRNSAAYTADSTVVAEVAGPARKGWEGRMSGLDLGIGSNRSSQQTKLPQSDDPPAPPRVPSTRERGHRKAPSWTPSFGAGGRDTETRLERGGADALPEEEAYQDGTYTTSQRNDAPPYAETGYAAQQPRALKRQTSIKQKLGDYIWPARAPSRYEMPDLTRARSLRRT